MSVDEIFNLIISIFLTLILMLPIFTFIAVRYGCARSLVEDMNEIKKINLMD